MLSCGERLKKGRGVISEMTDSTMTVTIDGNIDSYDITEASFTNGAVQLGDSIVMTYKGKKAHSIRLIEPKGRIVIFDSQNDSNIELLTRPQTETEKKNMKEAEKVFKDHGW